MFGEKNCNATVCCYTKLGCFSIAPPFDDFPFPDDPEVIAPTYYLYKRNGNKILEIIINSTKEINFERFLMLTHGYEGNIKNTPWHKSMIEKLLSERVSSIFFRTLI